MSAPVIRPVDLKTGPQNFRPLAMPRWTPPGQQAIFNEKRMGQKKLGASGTDEFARAIGFGALGVASVFIGSKMLPSTLGVLAIGAGVVGVLYSVGRLLPGDESAADVRPAGSSKVTDKADFDMISGKFEKPKMYEDTDYYVNAPALLFLTNKSEKPVEFILTVKQFEMEKSWYNPFSSQPGKFADVGNALEPQAVRLLPGENKPFPFEVDSDTYWPTAIRLVAEKLRSADDQPIKLAEVIFYG